MQLVTINKVKLNMTYFVTVFLTVVSTFSKKEIVFKKVDFPLDTWNRLSTTTTITREGIKQCGILCLLKSSYCNVFQFEKIGNICTYGYVREYYKKNVAKLSNNLFPRLCYHFCTYMFIFCKCSTILCKINFKCSTIQHIYNPKFDQNPLRIEWDISS